MARRYDSYSDKDLTEALMRVNGDLGLANDRYQECQRHRKVYWRNRLRSLGHRKRLVCAELARRRLLYDPQGRYSGSVGRKSDARKAQ